MISIFLLLILAWHFYLGYSRGLVVQIFYCLGSLVGLIVASLNYKNLASFLSLWVPYSNPGPDAQMNFFTQVNIFDLSKAFYAGVAFFSIYLLTYLVFRFLGIFLHLADWRRFDHYLPNLVAGGLAVLIVLVGFSFFFTILATIPLNSLQGILSGSPMVQLAINLPIFANLLNYWWFAAVI